MHNEDDSPCADVNKLFYIQGDTDENGQRYTQQWGAETVGYSSNTMIANDCVIGGSLNANVFKGIMYSLAYVSPLITGTSVALCDQVN